MFTVISELLLFDSGITVYTMKSDGDDLRQHCAAHRISVKGGSTYTVMFDKLKDDVVMVDFTSAVEGSVPAKDTLINPVAGVLYRLSINEQRCESPVFLRHWTEIAVCIFFILSLFLWYYFTRDET